MTIDVNKIDARIQRLQEVRRIAADPELIRMLSEFLVEESDTAETAPVAKAAVAAPVSISAQEQENLANQMIKDMELDLPKSGIWSRKRA